MPSDTRDVQILPLGVEDAPAAFVLPASMEIIPKVIFAVFDGTAASGSFEPTLEIISDSGHAVARIPVATTVAAGGAAAVSWFRGLGRYLLNQVPVASGNVHVHQAIRGDTSFFPDGGALFWGNIGNLWVTGPNTGTQVTLNADQVNDPQASDGIAVEWAAPIFAGFVAVADASHNASGQQNPPATLTEDVYDWQFPGWPPFPDLSAAIRMSLTVSARLTDPLMTGRISLQTRSDGLAPQTGFFIVSGGTNEPLPTALIDRGSVSTQTWSGTTNYTDLTWIVKYDPALNPGANPEFMVWPWADAGLGNILVDTLTLRWPV